VVRARTGFVLAAALLPVGGCDPFGAECDEITLTDEVDIEEGCIADGGRAYEEQLEEEHCAVSCEGADYCGVHIWVDDYGDTTCRLECRWEDVTSCPM
jgi:hypothetical protein